MSSHHVVREAQEPALLVLDANAKFSVAGPLLEWSPTVLVATAALPTCWAWQIHFDAVVGPAEDRAATAPLLAARDASDYLPVSDAAQALPAALGYLRARGHRALNVLGEATPERRGAASEVSDLTVVFYHGGFRAFFVGSGRYEKWLRAGQEVRTEHHRHRPTREGQYQLDLPIPCWVWEMI